MKEIEVKEFREKGYVQELNRRFLHPLGLALSIRINENGVEELGPILDYREDSEGIYFDIAKSDVERKQHFFLNKTFIDEEMVLRNKFRYKTLGFIIEPIETIKSE